VLTENRGKHGGKPASLPAAQFTDLKVDDAFDTIIAWLYSKLETPVVAAVTQRSAG
jgi:hypothetical protein